MTRFNRKKITKDAAGKKHGWRSGLEERMRIILEEAGLEANYEAKTFDYTIPESKHTYTPDFAVSPHIIIETKGLWDLEDRKKMLLVIAQHPEVEFRMIFDNANKKIKKGSNTSYADWCDKHNIKWAHKTIPAEWINDIFDDLAESL